MIGRIRGTLLEKQPPEILIEAAGIGYEIQLPMTSFYQLPEKDEEAIIYTHFVVRETEQLLFGFANKQERALFRELIKVNGVGPKMALTILSGMSAEQFVQCVNHDDVTSLVRLPGVGKKTAERLVIEMRDRLKDFAATHSLSATDELVTPNPIENTFVTAGSAKDEAISALLALGYKAPQATKVINSVYTEQMTSEELIRESLRSLA